MENPLGPVLNVNGLFVNYLVDEIGTRDSDGRCLQRIVGHLRDTGDPRGQIDIKTINLWMNSGSASKAYNGANGFIHHLLRAYVKASSFIQALRNADETELALRTEALVLGTATQKELCNPAWQPAPDCPLSAILNADSKYAKDLADIIVGDWTIRIAAEIGCFSYDFICSKFDPRNCGGDGSVAANKMIQACIAAGVTAEKFAKALDGVGMGGYSPALRERIKVYIKTQAQVKTQTIAPTYRDESVSAASSAQPTTGRKVLRKKVVTPMQQFLIVSKRGTVHETIETENPITTKADADEWLQVAVEDEDNKNIPIGIVVLASSIEKETKRLATTTHAVVVDGSTSDAPAAAAAATHEIHMPDAPATTMAAPAGRRIGGRIVSRETKKIDDVVIVHRVNNAHIVITPDDGPFKDLDEAQEMMERLASEDASGTWAVYVTNERIDIGTPKMTTKAMASIVHTT